MDKKIAVVTGTNRGIGLEICRQLAQKNFKVIMTSRDEAKGRAAFEKIAKGNPAVELFALDVASLPSIQTFKKNLQEKHGRLDVLINNAAVFLDSAGESLLKVDPDLISKTFQTNVFGPFLLSRELAPLMKNGRIINLSSGMGQLSEMGAGYPAYRLSKTSLNAVTRMLAAELAPQNISVNSMCPGWVKTDMGGPQAERPVEQGADTAVWLAGEADAAITGKFFRDRKEISW